MMSRYFDCPHCGAEVPQGALACPACGSDEETGWSDAAVYGELPPHEIYQEGAAKVWVPWTQILVTIVAAAALAGLLSRSLPSAVALAIPLLALGIGTAIWRNRRPGALAMPSEERLHQSLSRMALGDEALVERLINYEAQRSSSADRREHIQDAIDRWLRDAR